MEGTEDGYWPIVIGVAVIVFQALQWLGMSWFI